MAAPAACGCGSREDILRGRAGIFPLGEPSTRYRVPSSPPRRGATCIQLHRTTRGPAMTRRMLCIPLLLVAASPAPGADAGGWKAGAAKVNITPEQLMWMSGYASRTKPAEGTLHPLFARALVLEDPAGTRAVLVSLDLVGIPRPLSLDVCADLVHRYGLRREAIALASSHTHSGPVVRGNLETMFHLDDRQRQYVAEYRETLRAKIVAVVGEALQQLAPARLSWGQGTA